MIYNYFALFACCIYSASYMKWIHKLVWWINLYSPKPLSDLFIFSLFHVCQWFIRVSNLSVNTANGFVLRPPWYSDILTVARYVLDQSILIPVDSWITLSVQWSRNWNRYISIRISKFSYLDNSFSGNLCLSIKRPRRSGMLYYSLFYLKYIKSRNT
jgi:hypothetical protein